ncbi:MAG: pyridoxal phosphate-dependent aminotransferase [Oscillospiraceae bacterium]|nr:pyridoxal phosphate-dependent aminotransferase [Oscillospiraceae bacterium]
MRYDFDRVIDRRGTDAVKWQTAENELPMWIADMDFDAAPEIKEALRARVERGVFGYSDLTDEWYGAVTGWWRRRYGFAVDRSWLMFCTGVVPAISSIVRKLTTPAEKVVLTTPVYNIFYNSVLNNGRVVSESRLRYAGGRYTVDFDDLERRLADPQASLMILCNPHNPVGRLWTAEELGRIGELAARYGVTVVSDEIHCDITAPGTRYVPFASVSDVCRDNSVTCVAPTKSFNLAGLQTAAVFCADPRLRHKVWRGLNTDEVGDPNVFAVDAAVAAYEGGAEWLDAVRAYIFENKKRVRSFIETRLPELTVVPSEATYLLWIDAGKLPAAPLFEKYLREQAGLFLSPGAIFRGGGETFLRMNTACPRAIIEEALQRLEKGVEGWKALHR